VAWHAADIVPGWMGEEASMQQCFDRARQESPCVMILEDLDSLVSS
jgi:transitional endoplasmic reticulum ATPase